MRFLADENFSGDVLRGLRLQRPQVDVVRVQDVGLAGIVDPLVLQWAAENNRILLTHDRATMPHYAHERLRAGQEMSGVFVINDRLPTGQAIGELVLIFDCTQQIEWNGLVCYLPL